jgi:hypothetical protein
MEMPFPAAILLIAFGFVLAVFGLFLFYAWLPFFYALFGFEVGFWLGDRLFGQGSAPIVVGIMLGIVLAAATYTFEPYRRIVVGYLGGSLVALALLSLDRSTGGIFVAVVAVCGGVGGALVASKFFDYFVIATSAYGGAVLTGFGAWSLLSLLGAPTGGSGIEFLLTVALTAIGVGFQMRHLRSWTPAPLLPQAAPEPVGHESARRERSQ